MTIEKINELIEEFELANFNQGFNSGTHQKHLNNPIELLNIKVALIKAIEDAIKPPQEKTYILLKECRNIGKEAGDYYNGEYGSSKEKIQDLIDRKIIEEEETDPNYKPIDWTDWDKNLTK
jgi:hypothetical protein